MQLFVQATVNVLIPLNQRDSHCLVSTGLHNIVSLQLIIVRCSSDNVSQ
jgi:hypothetical protein